MFLVSCLELLVFFLGGCLFNMIVIIQSLMNKEILYVCVFFFLGVLIDMFVVRVFFFYFVMVVLLDFLF